MSIRIKDMKQDLPPGSVIVIYDIEGFGNVSYPSTCFMWNISAMVLGAPHNTFDQFITPPLSELPEPPHKKLFKVTPKFLQDAGAQPCPSTLDFFFKWIQNNYNTETGYIVMVSHGNFRYDQPLLQTELMRYGIIPPPNMYFFDTLHWFRSIKKGHQSFSLVNLYKDQFKKPIRNAHLAFFDVLALHDLIQAQVRPLFGIMYKCFHTALLRIPSVGLHTETLLFDKEINSIEHLAHTFMNKCRCNPQLLQSELIKMNVRPCIATTITQFVSTRFF